MLDLVGNGQNNVLQVGQFGLTLVGPCHLAYGAVPVLNVTGLFASCCLSLNVLNSMSDGQDHVLQVGDFAQQLVSPSSATLSAVPVFDVTLSLASCCLSFNMHDLVGDGQNNVLDVGQLSQSLILPYLLALLAVPVLDVTRLVAGCCLCFNMLNFAADCGNGQALVVGDNGALGIHVVNVAVSAVPVFVLAQVVTAGLSTLVVDSVCCAGGSDLIPAVLAVAALAGILNHVIFGCGIDLATAVGALTGLARCPCAVLVVIQLLVVSTAVDTIAGQTQRLLNLFVAGVVVTAPAPHKLAAS